MGMIDLGRYKAIVIAIALFLAFVAGVLALNFQVASRFVTDAIGVRHVAQQQAQPAVMYAATELVVARLKAGQNIDDALEELRRAARAFDETMGGLASVGALPDVDGRVVRIPQASSDQAAAILRSAWTRWSEYKSKLDPVLRFSGSPYSKEGTGIQLNSRGQRLQEALAELREYGVEADKDLTRMTTELASLFEAQSVSRANQLRIIQAVAMAAAVTLFIAILFYFVRNLRKEELISGRARKETEDILRTVNEGLFLLDRDLRIGTERSHALSSIFRREDLDGVSFEDLLRNIVPDKTLRTAMDYVALLWGERVNEKLVKTINPLNEVEVHFDNPTGGFDTHFLEFD